MCGQHSDADVDEALAAARSAVTGIVELRDAASQPSDAFAFLSTGLREARECGTPLSLARCAERFATVATWLAGLQDPAAEQMADAAERLRRASLAR